MATTINIGGVSNDTNLVLGSANARISDNGSVPNVAALQKFTVGSSWPNSFQGLGENAIKFVDDLTFIFKDLYDISMKDRIGDSYFKTGADLSYQGYIGADYYLMDYVNPALLFFTAAPFGMTTREHFSWLRYGGGQELWDELHGLNNIKPFAIGTTGYQGGIYSNKELNSVSDLSGLKLRMLLAGGEIWDLAGATVLNTRGGLITTELSNNNLDAVEWVSPYNDVAFQIPKYTSYHYPFSFQEPGNFLTFGMNKTQYDALSSDKKRQLQTIADSNLLDCIAYYEYQNGINLPLVYQDVSARELPADIKTLLKEKTKLYYENTINDLSGNAKDIYVRIINSYFTYLDRQKNWSALQNAYSSERDISLSLPFTV
jgi:TRAP-type mannitol/chloroaromatic compound transport system substrate-binding protein